MTQALRFDATASKVVIETRAKGMLAKLAHDLSIDAKDVAVTVELEAGSARLELRAPIARVHGLFLWISSPAPAVAVIALMLVIGASLGGLTVRESSASAQRTAYFASINPLHPAHLVTQQ